jgi:DNA polymerase-3 subunit gamma/tau
MSSEPEDKPSASSFDAPGAYVVLARKYRPNTFEGLIGQAAMVQTLRNAFTSGRIAQAYMLTGVRGVGKTTTARIIARALNYETDKISKATVDMPEPGIHCEAIMISAHVDVLEMDAASHTSVDDIRELIESARYMPATARYKVYIIDEVHMLSKSAFNALLKTLEEPPDHVKFIFATTEIHKVPVTILSRCQRFDLKRISVDELALHFREIATNEGVQVSDDALALIARAAEGSVRDGLSVLDQVIASGSGRAEAEDVRAILGLADRMRVLRLLEDTLHGDIKSALEKINNLYCDGAEPAAIIADMLETVHIITRTKIAGSALNSALAAKEREQSEQLAEKVSIPVLARAWQMLLKGLGEVNKSPSRLAAAEMVLIRMAHIADMPPPSDIIRKLADKNYQPDHAPPALPTTPAGGPQAGLLIPDARPAPKVKLESFEQVVSYVGEQRDLLLKRALEEHARLVCFKPGYIEMSLLAGAPKDMANNLMRKLGSWTGEQWMVAITSEDGGPTIGELRRHSEQKKLEAVKQHPLVRAALEHFPQARITNIPEDT